MKIIKTTFSIILLIYFIPTILSLMDIYQGIEPDLSSEWIIVIIFLLMVLGYVVFNLVRIKQLKKDQ